MRAGIEEEAIATAVAIIRAVRGRAGFISAPYKAARNWHFVRSVHAVMMPLHGLCFAVGFAAFSLAAIGGLIRDGDEHFFLAAVHARSPVQFEKGFEDTA